MIFIQTPFFQTSIKIVGAVSCWLSVVAYAATPYALSNSQFNRVMEVERANTQAIRDSMRFVNRVQKDYGSRDIAASNQPVNRVAQAEAAWAEAAQYQRMQNSGKLRVLEGLAMQGYEPAMMELGAAYLNADLGLKMRPEKALAYLKPVADNGDATAAFNVGIAYERMHEDEKALPYFEMAAQSGVQGATYKVTMSALFSRRFDKAITYGKLASRDKNAHAAYAVCLSAQFEKLPALEAEYCPQAFDLGYKDGAEDAGLGLAKMGRWEQAFAYFVKCAEYGRTVSCQRNAGLAAFKAKNWPVANQWLSQSEGAGDNNEDAQMSLALIAIYDKTPQWEFADRMLQAVLKHQGSHAAEAHFNLALVYQERPDKTYTDDEINAHMIAAARGGHDEAKKLLQEKGLAW